MVISFDNFLPNLIAGLLFFAICAVAIVILFKVGIALFRRLKGTDAVVKVLSLVGLLVVLFVLGIVMLWCAFFALYFLGGGGPLR